MISKELLIGLYLKLMLKIELSYCTSGASSVAFKTGLMQKRWGKMQSKRDLAVGNEVWLV